jgi:hypothetical protein
MIRNPTVSVKSFDDNASSAPGVEGTFSLPNSKNAEMESGHLSEKSHDAAPGVGSNTGAMGYHPYAYGAYNTRRRVKHQSFLNTPSLNDKQRSEGRKEHELKDEVPHFSGLGISNN